MQYRIDYYETWTAKDGTQKTKYEISTYVDTANACGFRHYIPGTFEGKVISGVSVLGAPEFAPGEFVEPVTESRMKRDGSLYTVITGFKKV